VVPVHDLRTEEVGRPFPEALDDQQIKHLEFVQAVIIRLANDSFLMKGWALTVAGLIFGFAVDLGNWRIAAAGLLPVAGFWGLDAYFLRQERLFRKLYDAVRAPKSPVEPFSMNTRPYVNAVESWIDTALSSTLLPFYGVIVLVGLILIFVDAFTK
jgi:hypothetical protein